MTWLYVRPSLTRNHLPQSLILEFAVLSRLTGDPRYEQVASRAFFALWNRRSATGLLGNAISATTGVSIPSISVSQSYLADHILFCVSGVDPTVDSSYVVLANVALRSWPALTPQLLICSDVGAGSDSFHEIALKAYILLGEEEYHDVFVEAYGAIMAKVRGEEGFWVSHVLQTSFHLLSS